MEDEDSLRELTRNLLVQSGYTVLDTNSGAQAVAIAEGYPETIHLVLTDVVLPGMSGRTVADTLVRKCPGVKVLFMSGYTENAVAVQGVLEAGTFLLQKPFDPETLKKKVREVLDAVPVKVKRAHHG